MAMFDIGKRGSGHERDARQEDLPENTPVAPVAQDWEAPGQGSVRRREAAVIGPSIHIDGTLKGEEDLLIEGRVTGTVQLQDHSLTIGAKGQVEANLYAHTVVVEGVVDGDLYGVERVAIRSSARVRGNVTAPRVSLEDGATFKGAVEMDPDAVAAAMGQRAGGASRPTGATATSGSSASAGSRTGSGTGGSSSAAAKAEKSETEASASKSEADDKPASKSGAGGSSA